jgi:hypothetical protein
MANMTMPSHCLFAQQNAGRTPLERLLKQAPAPRAGTSMSVLSWMVRAVGIEPTLLAERDFESRASTNSTTPALRQAYNDASNMCNVKSEQCSLFR